MTLGLHRDLQNGVSLLESAVVLHHVVVLLLPVFALFKDVLVLLLVEVAVHFPVLALSVVLFQAFTLL